MTRNLNWKPTTKQKERGGLFRLTANQIKMEETKKFKHYATDKIIEINIIGKTGYLNGKYFDIVKDKYNRTQLKGTSYFEVKNGN